MPHDTDGSDRKYTRQRSVLGNRRAADQLALMRVIGALDGSLRFGS